MSVTEKVIAANKLAMIPHEMAVFEEALKNAPFFCGGHKNLDKKRPVLVRGE